MIRNDFLGSIYLEYLHGKSEKTKQLTGINQAHFVFYCSVLLV
nr:hypothetical protein [Mucilaginibacter sp. SP1R1]